MSCSKFTIIPSRNSLFSCSGVEFGSIVDCNHTSAFSSNSVCSCNFCNYLLRLFNFYKKNKLSLNRNNIIKLCNKSFSDLFNLSCYLFSIKVLDEKFLDNAESLINHKFSREYDCSLPVNIGSNSQDCSHPSCWGVCSNAEHLFECSSISDSSRGEFFPISRTSNGWHTTCKKCDASCAFSSPREGIILIIFLMNLKVRYTGSKYLVCLQNDTLWQHCSRAFAMLVMALQGSFVSLRNLEIKNVDPEYVPIYSNVFLGSTREEGIDFGVESSFRYAKDANVLAIDATCDHEFYLTSCTGFQLKMHSNFMRSLMMYMPAHGYMNGGFTDENGFVVNLTQCGLLNVGGFIGLNMRCNIQFSALHEEFYGGPIAGSGENPPNSLTQEEYLTAHAQSGSEFLFEDELLAEEDIDKIEENVEPDYAQILEDFKNSDSNLLDVESQLYTSGRGLSLRKRVGGLLKGVTNCVSKLHAIWDWPLDKACELVNETADFFEKHKEYVSQDTWSCQICPSIIDDNKKNFGEQTKINEILKIGLERISKTLDSVTNMNKTNIEEIERRLLALESKIDEISQSKVPSSQENARDDSKLLENMGQLFKLYKLLRDRIDEFDKKKNPVRIRPEPTFNVGEQMGIPRNKPQPIVKYGTKSSVVEAEPLLEHVTKQSSTTEFKAEVVESTSVSNAVIEGAGRSEEHNIMLAKLYLGSFDWSVSDGEGRVLRDFSLPEDIWNKNPRLRNIVSCFQYYTCRGLQFIVTTTSVGMQGGTLMLNWDAMSCATKQKIDSVLQLSNLPKAFIHASESINSIFEISSPSIQHQMCTSGSEGSIGDLGTLKVSIVNVLNAATDTSQKIQVNVWVKFLDPKISFYTVPHDIVLAQSLANLGKIEGIECVEAIISMGKWSTTSPTNLLELTVHPTACHISNGLVTQTALSVISNMFARWKGTLKYRIIFGASLFVKGKLAVCAIPVAFRSKKLTIEQILSFPCVVCDLSGTQRVFEFDVPYISVGKNSLVNRDSLYDISSFNAELVVSRLHFIVLDSLVMNANASNSVSYCVTVQPGKDFVLEHPVGVKAEFVDRNLKQSFGSALSFKQLSGVGFKVLCEQPSILRKFVLNASAKNALHMMVSPAYRNLPPCTTSLSWLSQIFVQWSGSLIYTLRAHSHERQNASLFRVWYDCNGSPQSGEESEFLSDVDPPSGVQVHYWRPSETPQMSFTIPFCARTDKLLLAKTRYEPTSFDWLRVYNGAIVIDYEGKKEVSVELSIAGGEDFELYEQTVAPRCGRVSSAFTVLSYEKQLKGVSEFPLQKGRLGGPTNKAVVTPNKFAPIKPVDDVDIPPVVARGPREGDTAIDENTGYPLVFVNGQWEFEEDVQAHAGCFDFGVTDAKVAFRELNDRKTCSKLADIVDKSHEALIEGDTFANLLKATQHIMPLLESAKNLTGSLEDKMAQISGFQSKIMSIVKTFIGGSIPGMISSAIENEQSVWATLLTLLGGTSLLWVCKSKKSYIKKLSIFAMIVWSPLISSSVWKLGSWIKKNAFSMMHKKFDTETCRKHSMAGMFEGIKESFGNFAEWFSGNWAVSVQSLLSLLGVVASLVIWGSIPDEKKLKGFSSKFREAGNKGKNFSNIFGGFTSINKMSQEWSKKFVSWIMTVSGQVLPKSDSALALMLDFDLKGWVEEVRDMALMENRFSGFGGEEHLTKVRLLYDRSMKIQSALLDGVKVDAQLGFIIKECKTKCDELLNETYSYKGMKQNRIDPLHVCIKGKPGVGKSAISHVLINNLLDHRGEPEVDRIYTRCCADAYWSNYHQEPVIFYDDLGAIKSNLKLSDYAEIMGVKTNGPFSVPMAAVEDKGKHCTSKYIFSCTNILELDDNADVVTKTAFYRRRNILVDVELDPNVVREESNPTKGLLFTVLGYTLTDPEGNKVEFGIKETWDESFLNDIDTSDWRFERVDYKTFLKFLCVYTDAYMDSQVKLLHGIKHLRVDPFEVEVPVEAQNGKKIISLGDAIGKFDELKITGKEMCRLYSGNKMLPPDSWKTSKVVSFKNLMMGMCGCAKHKSCLFDLRFKQLLYVSGELGRQRTVFLDKLSKIPEETTLIVKDGDFMSKCSPINMFITLATYYRWSFNNDICFFHYFGQKIQKMSSNAVRKAQLEVFVEDSIGYEIDDNKVKWDSAAKFFPDVVSRVGCVPVFVDKMYYLMPDITVPCAEVQASSEWKNVWLFGLSGSVDAYELLSHDDASILRCIANGVTNFGSYDNFSADVRFAISQVLDLYGKGPELFTLMLILAEANAKKLEREELDAIASKKQNGFFQSPDRLLAYEKELVKGLSSKTKIALAVGAGIVATGVLVGLYCGIKSLFNISKEVVSDDEEESLVPEVSGAHESDMFQTSRVRVQRQRPRVVVTNLEPHVSGAHESDSMTTNHVKQNRQRPWFRSIAEGGMGVTYDETDNLSKQLYIERRKNFRKGVAKAVAHAISKNKGPKPDALVKIGKWQDVVVLKGVIKADPFVDGPLHKIYSKNTINGESQMSQGDLLVGDPEFEKDEQTLKLINEMVNMDVKDHCNLIKEGTQNVVAKQAQVGDYGLTRDVNMVTLLQTHIAKMSCTILRISNGVCQSYNVLRLKGTFVLAPAHYLEEFDVEDEFYFICPHKVVKIPYEPKMISLVSDIQDLIVWDLGNTVPPSVDYTCHIPTKDDWQHFRKTSGVLSLTKYNQNMTLQIVHALDGIELTSADVETPTGAYEIYGTSHTIITGLRYRVHCMPGFCGAAILRADTRAIRKIVGMHVAGQKQKGVGYAETLTLEPILAAIDRIGSYTICKVPNEEEPTLCEKQSVSFPGKGNLGILGKVIPRCIPNVPTKTTVAKSLIHGLIGEVKTEPSILSKWDKRLGDKRTHWDPVLDAVKKYGVPTNPFPLEEIKIVELHLSSVFSGFNNSLNKREVNSLEIGINGIDRSDFWSPIEMSTSAGYPYVLKKPSGATGKSWLFFQDGNYESGRPKYIVTSSALLENLKRMEGQILEGVVPNIITMECPKDERRKLNKIYGTPATRTFTILPPEINILFRMYFGDFAAMVMSTRFDHFSQVGINPESLEWSELMNSFLKKGKRGFAGDYAKFDGIGSAEIYHSIVNVVNNWYDDGAIKARARHCLINAIVHRDGIANDLLLRYSQGMPSGFSMTVIFNSFVNYYYMALAWMNIVSRSVLSPQADLASFDYYTKIIVYGDDNVVAVADEFLDVYNLRTVASYLSTYGITYTDDAKNPIHLSEPHVDITSVTFLKRSFVKVDKSGTLWKAPLDKISIEERCHWIRECEIPQEALYQNIESALFEASIHGEGYFNDLQHRIDSALDRVMLPKTKETFKACSSRWWANMTGSVFNQSDLYHLVSLAGKNQIDLNFKFRDMCVGDKLTLGDAMMKAKHSPLMYFEV